MTEERLDALRLLAAACKKHNVNLSLLVAETGIWASPWAHRLVLERTGQIALFPKVRRARARDGERRGQTINGVRLDDNSYANHAIKRCAGGNNKVFDGFESCHIWPKTCYDARYHTAVSNIVLLPAL